MFVCADCHNPKPEADFSAGQGVKPNPRCRGCIRARNQKYQSEHKDEALVQRAVRWVERKEQYKPARRLWAEHHRDEILQYQRDKRVSYTLFLEDVKGGTPCLDCGGEYPPDAMGFDHVLGDKVIGITQMWSWKREKVLAELAKCELVCANCHREHTIKRDHPKTKELREAFGG